jgi:hypothetical protein
MTESYLRGRADRPVRDRLLRLFPEGCDDFAEQVLRRKIRLVQPKIAVYAWTLMRSWQSLEGRASLPFRKFRTLDATDKQTTVMRGAGMPKS